MSIIYFIYSFFILSFSLFSYLFIDYNFPYLRLFYTGFYTDHRALVSILYLFFVAGFFSFYFLFLRTISKNLLKIKYIVILSAVILLFAYPAMLSYDIFNYFANSKTLFLYHENPYLFTPANFIGDPILQFTRATNKIALYGPLWTIISGIPLFFGFGNILLSLLEFKILVGLFYLGTAYLIFKITKNPLSTAFFALNPLVIVESLVSSHNDVFMMFLALLSFYLLFKNHKLRSIFIFLASVLIKYATLSLLPVFFYSIFKRIKNHNLDYEKLYLWSFLLMVLIFFLSFIREEIYPWYAIWFLVFASLMPGRKILLSFSLSLSLGLMLTYLPFMFSGSYFGSTPIIKNSLIVLFSLFGVLLGFSKKIWQKKLFS